MVFDFFNHEPTKSFNYKQVCQRLSVVDSSQRSLVNAIMEELFKEGKLEMISPGKYKLKAIAGYITGKVDLTLKGSAFIVSPDLERDVFVSQQNLKQAMHGDIVKVYLYASRKDARPEGEVVQVIERARQNFVGTIELSKNFAFLIPDSRQVPHDIFIPLEKLNGAKNGQKAVAKIVEWSPKSKNPIGEIVQVLGKAGENNTEMHAILAEFDLPINYPENITNAAEKIPAEIQNSEIEKRRDFRNITTFTIDPVDAKDFDDALSVQKINDNCWEVGVHIADVTHYVTPEGLIEEEAYNRATSVYLVDRVVPMLPEKLSNFICSLRPNEDKLCFSAVFELNENAEILSEWYGRTIINSDKRFSYEEAQKIIEDSAGVLSEELLLLNNLARKLRTERMKKGAIAFERSEVKFLLSEEGKPIGVYTKEMKDSNKLIEEFMLLANRKVAELIGKTKNKQTPKTFVYRIHDQPDIEKLNNFADFIRKFGYKLKTSSMTGISKSLNQLLEDVQGKKEQNVIEHLAVRSMAKAVYSTKNVGHYGLAFSHYTHFTSPIRRYPDMMVHRLLEHYLNKGKSVNAGEYEKMCKHSSDMEHRASEAERASIKYKQVEFMSDKIGRIYKGVISGITEWGIYVEIVENGCEGMIPIRDMNDDLYIFEEENYCIRGKFSKKIFQLGDDIEVEIIRANLAKKQLTFRLFQIS
jgi:ribonuclease R